MTRFFFILVTVKAVFVFQLARQVAMAPRACSSVTVIAGPDVTPSREPVYVRSAG
jgi:hypothetical protein